MKNFVRTGAPDIFGLGAPFLSGLPGTAGRVESFPNFTLSSGSKQSFLRPFTTIKMLSVESVIHSLTGLSIKPAGTAFHNETTSPATWREALNVTSTEIFRTY